MRGLSWYLFVGKEVGGGVGGGGSSLVLGTRLGRQGEESPNIPKKVCLLGLTETADADMRQ